MGRLIDADARVTVQSFDVEHEEYDYTEMSVAEALDFITDEGCPPAVDAAPVVRCKDCMYSYFADNRVPDEQAMFCERGGCSVTPDGFCAWGTPDYCEIGDDGDAR